MIKLIAKGEAKGKDFGFEHIIHFSVSILSSSFLKKKIIFGGGGWWLLQNPPSSSIFFIYKKKIKLPLNFLY